MKISRAVENTLSGIRKRLACVYNYSQMAHRPETPPDLWFLKVAAYVAFFSAALVAIYRLLRLRDAFRAEYRRQGQPYHDDEWGFGQILALFVWGTVFWEGILIIGKALYRRMRRNLE